MVTFEIAPSLSWKRLLQTTGMAAVLLTLAWLLQGDSVQAASQGTVVKLVVREGGVCDGNDCYARTDSTFHLSVDVVTAPAANYIAFQTYIDFGGAFNWTGDEDGAGPGSCADLIDPFGDGRDYFDSECTEVDIPFQPGANPADEVTWPDAAPVLIVRSPGVHARVTHGAVSGFLPPIPQSTWEGEILNLEMSCPATAASETIKLHPAGAVFIGPVGTSLVDINQVKYIPKLHTITMHCVEPTAGDYDGDGCSDATENGATAADGGDRNFVNPWDFYDVAGAGGPSTPDGVIDLSNDYLQVSLHYAPNGYPPGQGYEHYDRGPAATGGGSWHDTQPPDGVIDLANDILGVAAQIGHDCT